MVIVKVQSTTHWFLFTYRKDRICSETPSLAPKGGLEPPTYRLTVCHATDCVIWECYFLNSLTNIFCMRSSLIALSNLVKLPIHCQVLNRPDETILNCKQDTFFCVPALPTELPPHWREGLDSNQRPGVWQTKRLRLLCVSQTAVVISFCRT